MRVFGIIAGAVMAGLISMGGLVDALDVSDVVREWTPEGKKIAAERVKLPAHDEMVLVPAGSFTMGSDKKADKNSYQPEFPQRKVYLDAYEIDKFEVTTVQYLKFILAKDLPPLIDWQYEGGNFQAQASHPVMHVSWNDAEASASGPASAYRPQPNGRRRHAGRMGALSLGQSARGIEPSQLRPHRIVRTGPRPPRAAPALSADRFRGQVRECG